MMRDAVRRDMLLLIIGLSLMVAGFVFLVYLPGQNAEAAIRREISIAEETIREIPQRVAELEALKHERHLRHAYLQSNRHVMPAEEHLSSVVREIAKQAEDAGLRITRLEPLAFIPQESYERIPVRITVRGSFSRIAAFLQGLEEDVRLFAAQEMRLNSEKWDERGEVEGSVLFCVYAGREDFFDIVEFDESRPPSGADEEIK